MKVNSEIPQIPDHYDFSDIQIIPLDDNGDLSNSVPIVDSGMTRREFGIFFVLGAAAMLLRDPLPSMARRIEDLPIFNGMHVIEVSQEDIDLATKNGRAVALSSEEYNSLAAEMGWEIIPLDPEQRCGPAPVLPKGCYYIYGTSGCIIGYVCRIKMKTDGLRKPKK